MTAKKCNKCAVFLQLGSRSEVETSVSFNTLGSEFDVGTSVKAIGVGEGTPDMSIKGSVANGNGSIPPPLSDCAKNSHFFSRNLPRPLP